MFCLATSFLVISLIANSKYHTLFFPDKLTNIKIGAENLDRERFRKVETHNISLYIPKVFSYFGILTGDEYLSGVFLANLKTKSKGTILLENTSKIFQSPSLIKIEDYNKALKSYKNAYEFEKGILTENRGILFLANRIGMYIYPYGETLKIEAFEAPDCKGFIRTELNNKKGISTSFGYYVKIYSLDGKVSRTLGVLCPEELLTKKDLFKILGSVKWLNDQPKDAPKYYQEGLNLLKANDFVSAQFKFANAYYLNPNNPEYGYIFAKSIYKNSSSIAKSAIEILDDILKVRPDFRKAKELKSLIKEAKS